MPTNFSVTFTFRPTLAGWLAKQGRPVVQRGVTVHHVVVNSVEYDKLDSTTQMNALMHEFIHALTALASKELEYLKACERRLLDEAADYVINEELIASKSQLIKQWADENGVEVVDFKLAEAKPEDIEGLPRR